MNKNIIFAVVAIIAMQMQALEVSNTAGSLSSKITNLDITTLKVTGSMDARDFYFIADNLGKLETLDLQNVKVEACRTNESYYWRQVFAADELPVCAFGALNVTSVSMPSGVKVIGEAAFAGCRQLKSITWPVAVDSIGEYAFAGCESLESVVLPASVNVVGTGAFMRCTSLSSFTVESGSDLKRIDATALMDCPSLQTLALGNAVTTMGELSLAGTGISNLDLTANKSLRAIGDWALVKTPVVQAKLPSSVNELGDGVFLYDNSLTGVQLGGNVSTLNDYLFAGTGLNGELDLTGVQSLGDYALYGISTLSVVELPATMTWLGSYAMAGMTGMTELTCNAVDVPQLGEQVWAGVKQYNVPLIVPEESLDSYRAAEQWRNFKFPSTWLRGDVNGDGEVTIADINVLISIVLGSSFDAETMLRADVNEDKEIGIADINLVISIILSPENNAKSIVNTPDQLHLDDISMKPGEERVINLLLDNADEYSALQCDITLPQGLTLVSTATLSDHSQAGNEMSESTSRTVVYSMSKNSFEADGDVVLSIVVRADDALTGDGQIVLSNVMLSDNDNRGWHAADFAARVNNASGVKDLTVTADRLWVEGRTMCIESHTEGVARVVYINGITREIPLLAGMNRYELEPGYYVVILNNKSHKIAIK